MSYFSTQFARPEPSPRKSQWLLDFEQYMKDQAAKPKLNRPATPVAPRKPSGPRKHDYSGKVRGRLLRAKRKEQGLCTKCGDTPLPNMMQCAKCQADRHKRYELSVGHAPRPMKRGFLTKERAERLAA
jgi:hypothetical protein